MDDQDQLIGPIADANEVTRENGAGFVRPKTESMYDIAIQGEKIFYKGLADGYTFSEISNIPPKYRFYFMAGLCAGGHLIRIELMFQRISGPCDNNHLSYACRSGRLDVAKLIWRRVSQTRETLNNAMIDAGFHGSEEILSWLIDQGADDFNSALRGACLGGRQEIARIMIVAGAGDFNTGLYNACLRGKIKLAKMMVEHGATNLNEGFALACAGKYRSIMRYLARQGAARCNCGMITVTEHFCFPCCYI